MKKLLILFLSALCLSSQGLFAQSATAQVQKPEEKKPLESLLDTLKYPYQVTDSGDYQIVIEFEDNRTQMVIISPFMSIMTNKEAYDIWSTVLYYHGFIPDSVAQEMLIQCADTYAGRFQSFPGDEDILLVFSDIFYGDITPNVLNLLINEVAEVSDYFEFKLSAKDDY